MLQDASTSPLRNTLQLHISNPNPSYADLPPPPPPPPLTPPIPAPALPPRVLPPLMLDEKRRRRRATDEPFSTVPKPPPPPPPRYSASVGVGEIYASAPELEDAHQYRYKRCVTHPQRTWPHPNPRPRYPHPYPCYPQSQEPQYVPTALTSEPEPLPVSYANIRPLTISRPKRTRTRDPSLGGWARASEVDVPVQRYYHEPDPDPGRGQGRYPSQMVARPAYSNGDQHQQSSREIPSRSIVESGHPSSTNPHPHPHPYLRETSTSTSTSTSTPARRYPTLLSYVNEDEERTSGPPIQRHQQLARPPRQYQHSRPPPPLLPPPRPPHPQPQRPPQRPRPRPRLHEREPPRGGPAVSEQPHWHPAMSTSKNLKPTGTGTGSRNAKGIPYGPNGQREWSTDLCLFCDHNLGTWCAALWCPCIIYGRNKARIEHLYEQDKAHPARGGTCSDDCVVHACLTTFCLFGWAIQVPNRALIRRRYAIDGDWLGDCAAALFCSPCELAQESREIELEERSF